VWYLSVFSLEIIRGWGIGCVFFCSENCSKNKWWPYFSFLSPTTLSFSCSTSTKSRASGRFVSISTSQWLGSRSPRGKEREWVGTAHSYGQITILPRTGKKVLVVFGNRCIWSIFLFILFIYFFLHKLVYLPILSKLWSNIIHNF